MVYKIKMLRKKEKKTKTYGDKSRLVVVLSILLPVSVLGGFVIPVCDSRVMDTPVA